MKNFLRVEIYNITVVFFAEPTKVEFETVYHDNVTRITDKEYKQMYYDMADRYNKHLDNDIETYNRMLGHRR